MTAEETRRYEMLVRVHEFGNAEKDRFASSAASAACFATVAAVVEQLGEHAVQQQLTARAGRNRRTAARRALFAQLEAIGRTARALAISEPGFDDAFERPKRGSDQSLLTSGRAFAAAVAKARTRFVGHGLPSTFIEDLDASVDALAQAVQQHQDGRGHRMAARASISATVAAGWAAVRQLDVISANHLAGDPAALAKWQSARRLEYPRRLRRPRRPVQAEPPPAERPEQPGEEVPSVAAQS